LWYSVLSTTICSLSSDVIGGFQRLGKEEAAFDEVTTEAFSAGTTIASTSTE